MRLALAVVFGAIVALAPAQADTIFSNLSNQLTESNGQAICGSGCGETLSYAAAFTPSADYSMNEVQVLTAPSSGSTPDFNAYLYSNSSSAPGSVLATLANNETALARGSGPNVINLGSPIDLTSGTEYWLVLSPSVSDSLVAWWNGGPSLVPEAVSVNGGSFTAFTDSLQFEIDGTPLTATPEPRLAWLILASACVAATVFAKLRPQTTKRPT